MNPLLRAAASYLIGAAALVIAGLCVRWYGASQYQAGSDKANADHTLAELIEFRNLTERLGGLSDTLQGGLTVLHDAEPKIIERYTRVSVQSPLPAGCRIDANRLQLINEASRLANPTGQSRAAVHGGPRGNQR